MTTSKTRFGRIARGVAAGSLVLGLATRALGSVDSTMTPTVDRFHSEFATSVNIEVPAFHA